MTLTPDQLAQHYMTRWGRTLRILGGQEEPSEPVATSGKSQAQNRRGDTETAPDMAGTAAADSGAPGAQQ